MTSADVKLGILDGDGLRRFGDLWPEAIAAVTARFFSVNGSIYERYGPRGRDACREDLGFHLEFLRPVLEFGLTAPMVEYLRWLNDVLGVQGIPSEHVLLSIDWLGDFFAERLQPQDAAVVAADLSAVRSGFQVALETPPSEPLSPAPWPETSHFEDALLDGNRLAALDIVTTCLYHGRTLVETEMHVVQAALYAIGAKWQANEVTVAQEHLATVLAQSVMIHAMMSLPRVPVTGKRVLLACVETNHHAVGPRMVADAFRLDGWDVQFLGPNVPTGALLRQAADWKPQLVGLSVSFPQQLRYAKDAIERLRRLPNPPAIMMGGLAVNRFPPLAKLVGAVAMYADSASAVADAARLTGK